MTHQQPIPRVDHDPGESASLQTSDLWWGLSGLVLLASVILLSVLMSSDLGDTLTRNTVRLALTWYSAALLFMINNRQPDWSTATSRGRLTRWCWTWGMLSYLVHLTMAFHFFHHWSHADAFERTRQVSGTGEGIYVSHLFTLVWVGDVAWWWLSAESYSRRAIWIGRALHCFMLFIVFNGTVVYENGIIRWAGLFVFSVLLLMWLKGRPRYATFV